MKLDVVFVITPLVLIIIPFMSMSTNKALPYDDLCENGVTSQYGKDCLKYYVCENNKWVIKSCLVLTRRQKKALPVCTCLNADGHSRSPAESFMPNCTHDGELLANPYSCISFFKCANVQPILMYCPVDQHWWDAQKRCDWPDQAQCTKQHPNGTDTEPIEQKCAIPGEKYPDISNSSQYYVCHERHILVLSSCPYGLVFSAHFNKCDCPVIKNRKSPTLSISCDCDGQLFKNPTSCESFLKCYDNVPHVVMCPAGQEWWDYMQQCEFPYKAQCTLDPTGDDCTKAGSRKPNAKDPASYYFCNHLNFWERIDCPVGLVWHDDLQKCYCKDIFDASSARNIYNCDGFVISDPATCARYLSKFEEIFVPKPCPTGTYWRNELQRCDDWHLADCKWKAKETCNSINSSYPNPGNCSTYFICDTDETLTLRECDFGLVFNEALNKCDVPELSQTDFCETHCDKIHANYPHPENCSVYYTCDIFHRKSLKTCPDGMFYNNDTLNCDFVGYSFCENSGKPSDPDTTVDCRGRHGDLLPNPVSCFSFYQCVGDEPVLLDCPQGLEWHAEKGQCDWPEIANCSPKFIACEELNKLVIGKRSVVIKKKARKGFWSFLTG